jgi:Uma2 family endonuclease
MSIGTLPTLPPIPTAPVDVIGDDELYEVVDGQRVRTPPMATISVWTASELARHLGNFAVAKLGRVITEALFHLPAPINRDRRPDVAFVSYKRWPKTKPVPSGDPWDVVPNLAIEVVSPTDKAGELETKIAEYFSAGVELAWVVYPTLSKIHVYSSPTQPITVFNVGDVLDGDTVVPGFKLPLAELFTEAPDAAGLSG